MTAATDQFSPRDAALLDLLQALGEADYRFVTPTKRTHALVRDRRRADSTDVLRDVFGWCRPFDPEQLPTAFVDLMRWSGLLQQSADGYRSRLQVSTVGGQLFAHTAPSSANDAVFLGPDSYRFARFLTQSLGHGQSGHHPSFERALDLGTGAGVGALVLGGLKAARTLVASDVNEEALRLARINAAYAGVALETVRCDGLPEGQRFDLVVSNPPFIAGDAGKIYRDGGGLYGAELALGWVRQTLPSLASGCRFLLYTGAPIVAGEDLVLQALRELSDAFGFGLAYEEIDPDIFGSTLRRELYADVERIAAIGAVLTAA